MNCEQPAGGWGLESGWHHKDAHFQSGSVNLHTCFSFFFFFALFCCYIVGKEICLGENPDPFMCSNSAFVRAELAMETPAWLECFTRSRQKHGRPRLFRLLTPFRQVRCYPEKAPPQRQCTYRLGQEFLQTLGAALPVSALKNLSCVWFCCSLIPAFPSHSDPSLRWATWPQILTHSASSALFLCSPSHQRSL